MADDIIRHVNCASDFRIVFAFSDGKLPDYPWRLGLKTPNTPSYNMYVASFDGTTYNNCSPLDDESIMVFVDHHRLVPGILHYYLQTDAPDSLFPDGEMNVTIPGTVNIELWEGPSDGDTPPEVTVIVERLLKGDKGDPGEAGQITSATASVDNTTGTPSVKIELGGTPEKRTIDLKFSGLKGEPGEPDEYFVRYDKAQDLTTSEQNQALGNIGIDLVRLPYSLLNTTLSDEMANVINNARGIILVDTPNAFILPTIYNKGRTTSTSAKFIAIGEVKDVYYISYNKNTKALATIVHDYTDNGCVRYVQEQSLTDTQKDTVLSNIGLNWIHVPYSLLGTTLDDATYTKLTNAYGIILTDVPSAYTGPIEFIRGVFNTNNYIFVNFYTQTTISRITIYPNNKRITSVYYSRTHEGAIPYDASINITSAQQDVALSNIGLNFVHVDYALLGTILDDSTAALVENANGIVLTNTPESYSKASVFLKSVYSNNIIYFNAWNGVSLVSQFSYNISTKQLTAVSATDLHFDSVRYNVSQDLTDAQKQQARTNIGVKSADELLADDDFIAQLKTKLGIG